MIIYFFWLSLRARSFLFFSASNPGIVMGGMFGESKFEVLKKVPSRYVAKTTFISMPCGKADVIHAMHTHGLTLPVIFKPDLGERGFMVRRINTESDIESYLSRMTHSFIVQELIDLPLEFGVFYQRYPSEPKGKVTSVVMKEMLAVVGDGISTLQELIQHQDRAKLQWKTLKRTYSGRLHEIVPKGKKIELVSIGNHCLGTKFLDGSHLINNKLSATFDKMSRKIEGFYFGRFDLRCASVDDLYEGRVKILELNGCGAEPAHIYHPGYSLFKAIGVLLEHWRNIFLIARENADRGTSYIQFKDARRYYKKFKAATQLP
ncbi:MAG TPA: hypothetical protein VFZ52_20255 [Chryseolinea sp.]